MITRQASFKDYSKLGELIGTELVAQWMLHSRDNYNCVSLITLDKKQVIACYLGEYKQNTVSTKFYSYPEDKPEIGQFLLSRVVMFFNVQNKEIKSIISTEVKTLWEEDDDREIQIS